MITVTGKDYRDRERLQRQGKITETGKDYIDREGYRDMEKTRKVYKDRKGLHR